jgi:nucleoside-diphosphate-sugar epimerase
VKLGVTGATGHLGQHLLPRATAAGHDVTPIGRGEIPRRLDAVIHLAAPNHKDDAAVRAFYDFNLALRDSGVPVISAGSWWQVAAGESRDLAYTRLKGWQQQDFPVTVVLYSIYGHSVRDGRGFVPQLIGHAREATRLAGASRQVRDWIHADDAADALLAALRAPRGVYAACTGAPISPADLALLVTGERLPDYDEHPACWPTYPHPTVPGWEPRIDVRDYVRAALEDA